MNDVEPALFAEVVVYNRVESPVHSDKALLR